jgi:hypothetical protein
VILHTKYTKRRLDDSIYGPWLGTAVVLEDNDSYMSGCYIHCVGLGLELQGSVNTILNTHFATNWDWCVYMYS